MVYTIAEIRDRIIPVAEKYDLPAVYIFGSYARGDATEASDIDILIDDEGSKVKTLFHMGGLYEDLRENLQKSIDLVTFESLDNDAVRQIDHALLDSIVRDGVMLYERP